MVQISQYKVKTQKKKFINMISNITKKKQMRYFKLSCNDIYYGQSGMMLKTKVNHIESMLKKMKFFVSKNETIVYNYRQTGIRLD